MKKYLILLIMLCVTALYTACDSDSGGGGCLDPGQVTFGAEQGADLCTGEVLVGSHATDLWAVDGGGKLAFMSGGDSAPKPRPVNWFNPGGYQKAYDSLAMVPSSAADLPTESIGITLQKAKEGGGFILMRSDGTWVKGWFATLTATQVTVQFAPLEFDSP